MHSVGTGKQRETEKNMENGECKVQDLEYGEKTENHG